MFDFIKKHVNVKKTCPPHNIKSNIILIDDDFMIQGSSSLELNNKANHDTDFSINFDTFIFSAMDKTQIVSAKEIFERIWYGNNITIDFKYELLKSLEYVYKEHSPEFLYYFTLNDLFGKQLDLSVERFETDNNNFKKTKIWNMLYNFQKDCVLLAIKKLNNYGGCRNIHTTANNWRYN